LRGIAALLVCLYHFTNYTGIHGNLFEAGSLMQKTGSFGYLGVFIFFVLSGFVIPLSLHSSNFKLKNFGGFLLKRYVRIEIPYLFSIGLILAVAFAFSVANHVSFDFDAKRFASHLFYMVPFTGHEWYNEIYWTLAIEMQFYILIAVVFVFLDKDYIIASLALLLLLLPGIFWNDNRFVTFFLPFFVAGMACYLHKVHNLPASIFLPVLLCSMGAAFYLFKWYEALIIPLTSAAILYMPLWDDKKFRTGKISYSLYLTHGIIGGNFIYFLISPQTGIGGRIFIFLGAIAVSIIFAKGFYWLIEKPSQRLSKRMNRQ
jgi:peptidoglycan/LPS O-acetylase OafA/YrhL